MKLTIEGIRDDKGKPLPDVIYDNVEDLYICVRQLTPMQGKKGKIAFLPECRSHSWGSSVRELLKEIRQSIEELQAYLNGTRG